MKDVYDLTTIVDSSLFPWFNSYAEHYTLPESGIRWSVRIDGQFSNDFKEKLKQL